MNRLVRAELLKVRTTRMAYWLALVAAALAVLGVAGAAYGRHDASMPPLDSPAGVRAVFASAGAAQLLALVIGIIAMSGEWRHKTATATFLGVPRRGRVVMAKVIAQAIVGCVYGAVAVVATIAAAYAFLGAKHIDFTVTDDGIPGLLGGAILATVVYAVLGVAYGALVRNQIVAVASALVWSTAVDSLLVAFLPKLGKWTPGGAAQALAQVARRRDLLPVWGGALLLVAYAAAFALVALRTTLSRDIT